MNACVGLTYAAVVHDSIFGFDPPLFQKSGMPSELLSVSRVGLGQMLPGRIPAWRSAGARISESIAVKRQTNRRGTCNDWDMVKLKITTLNHNTYSSSQPWLIMLKPGLGSEFPLA